MKGVTPVPGPTHIKGILESKGALNVDGIV